MSLPAIPRLGPSLGLSLALLYAALGPFATPATAQPLTGDQRGALEALRAGDMRKLVLEDSPAPLPDTAFSRRDGGSVRLADSNGGLRLVNFWATWCAPCREEFPALDALARDDPAIEVIAVATGPNAPDGIDRFLGEAGIEQIGTYLDPDSSLAHAMSVRGLPVTVILASDGTEIGRLIGGADWDGTDARKVLDYLVALPE